MRLSLRPAPFDSDEYLYELKIDGFRALAHIAKDKGELISRNRNVFRGFAELATWIAEHLKVEDAVFDGEIACIDGEGRPVFKDLLFRKSTCIFVAFYLLYLNGKDLRTLPLIERKRQLRELLRRRRSRILYLDHVENDGRLLFERIVKMDLEGMRLQTKDLALPRNGKAVTIRDQGQESSLQPTGRTRGTLRAAIIRKCSGPRFALVPPVLSCSSENTLLLWSNELGSR